MRSARLGELVQLERQPRTNWLEGRGPGGLTALDIAGRLPPAKSWPRDSSPSETTFGYLCLLRQLRR